MREWTERHIRELIKNEIAKAGGGGGGGGSGYPGIAVPTVRAKIHPTSRPAGGGVPELDTHGLSYVTDLAVKLGDVPEDSNYTTNGFNTSITGTFIVDDQINFVPGITFLKDRGFAISSFTLSNRPFLIPDIQIYKNSFPSIETTPLVLETTLDFENMKILSTGSYDVELSSGETLTGRLLITGIVGRVDVEMSLIYSVSDSTYYIRVNPIRFQRFVESHTTDDTVIQLLDDEYNRQLGFTYKGYSDIQINYDIGEQTLSFIPYKYPVDQNKNTQPWIEILDTDKEAT